jgi:putative transposase
MATTNRPQKRELLFHSDRGIQYASAEFRAQFKGQTVLQSMTGPPGGRKGNCWDNAVAESFFNPLKAELICHVSFETRRQAKVAIFEYIEGCGPPGGITENGALGARILAPLPKRSPFYN